MMEKFTRMIAKGGALCVFPMMVITLADVIGRAFFDKPWPGAFEVSEYLLGVMILCGAAFTHRVGGHVRVLVVVQRLHGRVLKAINLTTGVLSLMVFAVLVWQGLIEALQCTIVSDMLRIPQRPFRFLVPLAGVMLFLETVRSFWTDKQST